MVSYSQWMTGLAKRPGALVIIISIFFVLFSAYGINVWLGEHELAAARKAEELATAATRVKQQMDQERQDLLKHHDEERAVWAAQQADLLRSVSARNQATDRLIALALAPKTPIEVQKEAGRVLGVEPDLEKDGSFRVTMAQLQEFTATKIDRDRLAENLAATEHQFKLEHQTADSLRADLTRAITSLEQSQKVIDFQMDAIKGYKSAAIRTRRQKVFSVVGKVVQVAATGFLVAALTR